jgi:uncharacterized protein (UPF0303 family)
MDLEQDLNLIAEQESLLQFSSFTSDDAWAIGTLLRHEALARNAGMTFEIQLAGRQLLLLTTIGAKADHLEWIRRKRNVTMRFVRSSYWMSLELELKAKPMPQRHEGLAFADYAMHGGAFPITLKGTGLVGSIIASGLHQRTDHALVVNAIATHLHLDVPRLTL